MSRVRHERDWEHPSTDSATVNILVEALGCPRPVATVLANRGISDPKAARRFMQPSLADLHAPRDLPDIEAAVDLLSDACESKSRIAVYADRDVDGGCAGAILVKLLDSLGADVRYSVPGKYDGYGLHTDIIEELAARSVDLLATVDCGTAAHEEIEYARSQGMSVVVTDHHPPEGDLPRAEAVVNPRRPDSQYPNSNLAGAGVAFKLGDALIDTVRPSRKDRYYEWALPLAAVATVGDYMDLRQENRAIVREGFDRLFESDLTGLVETARHAEVDSVRDLSWSLAPVLNASQESRDGEFMLDLLLAEDADAITEMLSDLDEYRAQRQADQGDQLAHLRDCVATQADPDDSLILVETEAYVGGSALNQISEEYDKPVVAYRWSNGVYKGGCRSKSDIDFRELYEHVEYLLEDFWGHPGAAGFTVAAEDIEQFTQDLRKALEDEYDTADLRPTIEIEGTISERDLNRHLADAIGALGPFGPGNSEPVFLLESVEIESYEFFGDGDEYCRLTPAASAATLLDWDGIVDVESLDIPCHCDVAGTIGYDTFREKPSVAITDIRSRSRP